MATTNNLAPIHEMLEFISPAELGFVLDELFTEYSYYLATHNDQAMMVIEGRNHLYYLNQLRNSFFQIGGVMPSTAPL